MTRLSVPDMSCGHCKAAIEKALGEMDPAAKIVIDLPGRTVEVQSARPLPEILKALDEAGYPARAA